MKQVITILLRPNKKIEEIRKKSGINTKKFKPHINIIYPFELKDQKRLFKHIKESIKNIKKFRLTLKGLKKSTKEYYLYLLVDKGKKQTRRLYNQLHKGILKDFKNKDMPKYIPHLSLGNFKSKKEIDKAIKEIKKENIYFETKISSVQLLTLNKDSSLKSVKNFKL
tara:strand:- start:1704 stop:2204 length:501 start_codon:yes stop_codon:yes gene_type:complete